MKKIKFAGLILMVLMLSFSAFSCIGEEKEDSSEDPSVATQLEDAGYELPDVQVRGVSDFNITDSSDASRGSADKSPSRSAIKKYGVKSAISRSAEVSTGEGVVVYTFGLANDISGNVTVQIWKNGVLSPEEPVEDLLAECEGSIVLDPGKNFICVVVLVDGDLYGRSDVLLVNSNVEGSLYRFEMSWDNEGDVDLHLDTTDGLFHVYYGEEIYNANSYNVELDVDNTFGYGPENIRVYSAPADISKMRLFVDYYEAYVNVDVNVTVRIYKNDVLVDTKAILLTLADDLASDPPSFGLNSKVVDLSSIR